MIQRDEKTQKFTMSDLTGQRFGMLTALEALEERHQGCVIWRCQCDCGNIVLRKIPCPSRSAELKQANFAF